MSAPGVVIVTGGTAGIGLAAAQALAKRGKRVVITGREKARVDAVAAQIGAEGITLDLESFRSVRAFAAAVRAGFPRIEALVHNAGAVYPRRRITEDGHEAQLQVIHLGPFLLNGLLADVLKQSAPARIVNVVSSLHENAGALDDWDAARSWSALPLLGSVRSYARAELFKVCTTLVLARRFAGTGVDVNCVHPGAVRTRLFRQFHGPLAWLLWLSDLLKRGPAWGSRGLVHLAAEDAVRGLTGRYFVGTRERRPSKRARDEALQQQVWTESERRVLAL